MSTSLPTVIKRDGTREEIQFDKITQRISSLVKGTQGTQGTPGILPLYDINSHTIAKHVVERVFDGVETYKLDIEAARIAHNYTLENPEYSKLAARILISNLYKNTRDKFSEAMEVLYNNNVLNDNTWNFIKANADALDEVVDNYNDFNNYDYFGFKTLESDYLLKCEDKVIERPQYALMRVSCGMHFDNLEKAIDTYKDMSNKYFTHATPTLFHSGTRRNQFASCYLIYVPDSIRGIFTAITQTAFCSKNTGGVGIHFNDIRARKGMFSGPIPFLKIFNDTGVAVNQGGRRPGSIAVYFEPHHPDIKQFLEMRLNSGSERERARDLFPAFWSNELFWDRVFNDQMWSLFCPNECPGLSDAFGNDYKVLYEKYEKEKKYTQQLPAMEIFRWLLKSLSETGLPYILNKDAANRRNNQANLGTLYGFNLCAEIAIKTSPDEMGTCNLASVALCKFVDEEAKTFDFNKLYETVRKVTYNLNRVIDITNYPTEEARRSNTRHRPIAIGVTGLWDAIMMMDYDFTSDEAIDLNTKIFETMYFAFLSESHSLAKKHGPYESFKGSPISKGKFQWDLWNDEIDELGATHRPKAKLSGMWDWEKLRVEIMEHGVRNSLGIALMPTASTSNIMGFSECFECIMSNQFIRRTKSGEFYVANRHLYKDLKKLGLWTKEIRDLITYHDGSIQEIEEIPEHIRNRYKVASEQDQKRIIDMCVARIPFIDHTESHNVYIDEFDDNKVASIIKYAVKMGLKTISYYFRQRVKSTMKFAIKKKTLEAPNAPLIPVRTHTESSKEELINSSSHEDGGCTACE